MHARTRLRWRCRHLPCNFYCSLQRRRRRRPQMIHFSSTLAEEGWKSKYESPPLTHPKKKRVQVGSSFQAMPITWTSEATAALMSGTRRLGGRTVYLYPLCVCGWFPWKADEFSMGRSESQVSGWCGKLSVVFATTVRRERPRSWVVRSMASEDQERFVWFTRTYSGFELLNFCPPKPWIIIPLWKELSWPHPSCRVNQHFRKCNDQYPTFPRVSPYDPMFPKERCSLLSPSQTPVFQSDLLPRLA